MSERTGAIVAIALAVTAVVLSIISLVATH